jgi:hypothetical protein
MGGFTQAIEGLTANTLLGLTVVGLAFLLAILYALRRWREHNSHSVQQIVTAVLTQPETSAHTWRSGPESRDVSLELSSENIGSFRNSHEASGERTLLDLPTPDRNINQRMFRTTRGRRMSVRPNQPIVLAENATPQDLLVHGQAHLAAGSIDAAARDFRACVMLAAKLKQPHIGATARLELGDLASAAGDMTTACEHWQMAKTAFIEQGRDAELISVEGKMDQAGCPTDWVLNEF